MPTDPGPDFATVLSEAIKARGLSLERIRHRLEAAGVKISVATLSYWQNGRSLPSRTQSQLALAALESVLELEPGTLTSLAPVAQTRRRPRQAQAMVELPSSVEDALEQAELATGRLRTVTATVTLTVAADRTYSSEVIRKVVQCVEPGTSCFPLVVDDDGLATGGAVQEVQALANCTVGRRFRVPGDSLIITEMLLPRPLRQGELLMLEYLTAFAPGRQATDSARSLGLAAQRMNVLVLEAHFCERDLPSRVVAFSVPPGEDPGEQTDLDRPGAVELSLLGGVAQSVHLDVSPGLYFLRWEW